MKTCRKCKETKDLTEFSKRLKNKDGLYSYCKLCKKDIDKQYRINNIEKIKQSRENNIEKHKQSAKNYRSTESYKIWRKNYRILNKEKYKEWDKKNKNKRKDKNKIAIKKWRQKNKEKIRQYSRIMSSNRYKNDKLFNLTVLLRNMMGKSFKRNGYTKRSKTYEILGCSFEDFKIHIERQFTKGMTWDNRDKWHIDHIIPMATAKTEEEVIRLNHYTNLRPLWAEENLSKSDKIITHQLVLL